MTMAKELSVRAHMNSLEVGCSADYPIERYDYIVNCRTRLQIATGKKFTSAIKRAAGLVTITRIY